MSKKEPVPGRRPPPPRYGKIMRSSESGEFIIAKKAMTRPKTLTAAEIKTLAASVLSQKPKKK
jgi:hypothetical protein